MSRRALVAMGLLVVVVALAGVLAVMVAPAHPGRGPASRRASLLPVVHSTSPPTTVSGPPTSQLSHSGSKPPPAPVVGMSLVSAQRAIAASGDKTGVTVTAEIVDAGVRPETVLSQTDDSVVVSVPPERACSPTQLAATYVFNQASLGNVFASVVIRDTSASWCTIEAPIALVGLSSDGQGVAGPTTVTSLNPVAIDALSPNTPPVPATMPTVVGTGFGYELGTFFATVSFYGPFNTCTPEIPTPSVKHVAPSLWRVTLASGVSIDARNGTRSLDTTPTAPAARTARPFETCAGTIHGQGATVRYGNTNLLSN